MPDRPKAESSIAGRQLLLSVMQGALAGTAGGALLLPMFPQIVALIAAQADEALSYGLIVFVCAQIGVTAAILIAVFEQACAGDR